MNVLNYLDIDIQLTDERICVPIEQPNMYTLAIHICDLYIRIYL